MLHSLGSRRVLFVAVGSSSTTTRSSSFLDVFWILPLFRFVPCALGTHNMSAYFHKRARLLQMLLKAKLRFIAVARNSFCYCEAW